MIKSSIIPPVSFVKTVYFAKLFLAILKLLGVNFDKN